MSRIQRYELTAHNSLKESDNGMWAIWQHVADRIEELEREKDTLRAALEPFALAVERAEKAATAFGMSHRAEVPDSRDFGPMVITWGDLRRAAAIRNMGGRGNG